MTLRERQPAGHVWLASYPKSGNTWFRFVLFHLTNGRSPSTSAELDQFMNSALPREGDAGRFIKSHATADVVAPFFSTTRAVIYLHRHPLDVLQSAMNYGALTGEITKGAAQAWAESFIEAGGNPAWFGPHYFAGSWSQNVESWLSAREVPVCALSYDAALKEPGKAIARIANFLEIDVDDLSISAAVEATRFEALKQFEEIELARAERRRKPQGRFSTPERMAAAAEGARFFNRGESGAYRTALSPELIALAWEKFGPAAAKLGYSLYR